MGSLFEGPDVSGKINLQAQKALKKGSKAIEKGLAAASDLAPTNFSAGGLSSSFNNGSISLTSSPERAGLVSTLASRFGAQAGLVRDLRARVAPGVSELRASRLQEIEDARKAAISNLRDNLARRRVLGSSFADDALARANIGFARESERVAAESTLQEIDLTNQFIDQEFNLARQETATFINELNLQADVAANLTAQANDVLKTSAALQAELATADANFRANILNTQAQGILAQGQLDAQAQAGFGSLVGKLALAPVTGGGSLIGSALS